MSDDRPKAPVPRSAGAGPPRKLDDWWRKAESAIQEAMDEGLFDNLPGRGKPLVWDTAHDDEHWLANHLLKNAGYVPAWIEDAKWIAQEREALKEAIARLARDPAPSVRRTEALRVRASALNRRIDSFNLSVPIDRLQVPRLRFTLRPDEEAGQEATDTG